MSKSLLSCLVVAVFILLRPLAVLALPADMEADRLLLAAEEKLTAQDYEAARGYLQRITPLKVTPAPRYYYLSGLVAFHYGELDQAGEQLSQYVETAGRDAQYYDSALRTLTQIEEQQASREAVSRNRDQMQSIRASSGITIEDTAGQAYDAKVRKQFPASSLKQSLILKINSLLESNVFLEGVVKNPQRSPRLEYQVAVSGGADINVTRRQVDSMGQVALTSDNLEAFGVNPFVSFRCSKATDQCAIRHPASGEDWIVVARDEDAARELATALTRLIKALQR